MPDPLTYSIEQLDVRAGRFTFAGLRGSCQEVHVLEDGEQMISHYTVMTRFSFTLWWKFLPWYSGLGLFGKKRGKDLLRRVIFSMMVLSIW